jgi:hypothetical protein
MPEWIIKSESGNVWSETLGWTNDESLASKYTEAARGRVLNLPVQGFWKELPKKEKPVCSSCGSDNVKADAWAVWDVAAQQWTLSETFEKPAICENCDGECSIEWVQA